MLFTFDISEGQEENYRARDYPVLFTFFLKDVVGLPEGVGSDDVNTNSSVKDETISASGIIAKGDKVHQVIKQLHGDVETDSIPEETLGFSIKTSLVEGASDEEGDDDDALQNFVDFVGAHLIRHSS